MNTINQYDHCDKCEMRKICKKDRFSDEPEEKIPSCFYATRTIQDKAQQELTDAVISWIKYDMEDKLFKRTLKTITAINAAVLIFQIIKLILHL